MIHIVNLQKSPFVQRLRVAQRDTSAPVRPRQLHLPELLLDQVAADSFSGERAALAEQTVLEAYLKESGRDSRLDQVACDVVVDGVPCSLTDVEEMTAEDVDQVVFGNVLAIDAHGARVAGAGLHRLRCIIGGGVDLGLRGSALIRIFSYR